MKYFDMSGNWKFGDDPFPAFRVNLVFGLNKRDREFLPVKDVKPVIFYTVTTDYGRSKLYEGTDKDTAEQAKSEYDSAQEQSWKRAEIKASRPILPEGQFKVIKTKAKGTIMVVPGSDKTNRCLLFVGENGGFRGSVSMLEKATNAKILKTCKAGSACESRIEVVAILGVDQQVLFHVTGRRSNEVFVYSFDGNHVKRIHYSKQEWDIRQAIEQGNVDGEEL